MTRALRRTAIARSTLACVRDGLPAVYLTGSAPAQRRVGALCMQVPWSIGLGLFEVALFDSAIRAVGFSNDSVRRAPAARSLVCCGLCGMRIGEDWAGHPLEAELGKIGVASWM